MLRGQFPGEFGGIVCEYINKFLVWFRDLDKIKGEGLSKGHAVHLFLKNIIGEDYKSSVTYCCNTGCSLIYALLL
jgi:hypothetical protein